jgi:hypothetical protein
MTNPRIRALLISCFSIWWGWTVLTDFFIVPSVFKMVPDFFTAGELGMTLFRKLNLLELVLAIFILALSLMPKRSKFLISLSPLLLIIASVYFFYLTPKIQTLTDWWKEAESLGVSSLHGIADIQQEHQKFHKLYVSIDAVKLLLLTSGLGFLIFKHEPKHA